MRERSSTPSRNLKGMKPARPTVSIVVLFGGVWLALTSLIGVVAMRSALHPARKSLDAGDDAAARDVAARDHASMLEVSLAAGDGTTQRGWLFTLPQGNGDAVILLHGLEDNRAGMLGNADLLLRHGFSVLLPDARAHGESGGAIATYGLKEPDDVRRWFEWVQGPLAPDCIDGLGNSMGAASLLQSLAVEPHFCAVVAESPFASFREASYDRLGQWFGTGPGLGRTAF